MKTLRGRARDLLMRFVEFYHFAHRDFIYDGTGVNDSVLDLLEADTDGPWSDKPEMHHPIASLNNGDCFIAALAVGEVLRLEGHKVKYYANGGHYFFSLKVVTLVGKSLRRTQDVYFDTIFPYGKIVYFDMLHPKDPDLIFDAEGSASWLSERALESSLDIEFIEQFVRFYVPDYVYPYSVGMHVNPNKWFYRQKEVT